MRAFRSRVFLLGLGILAALGTGELALRFLTRSDPDGQVALFGRPLLPYRFPVEATRTAVREYLERRPEAYIIRDPDLGWVPAPGASGAGGLYRTNSAGIRSAPREFERLPPAGVLRVALFGDSFTHGDEEPWEKSWAAFLEEDLAAAGVRAEVLNFGVPGYGFDQAYLRFLRDGRAFHPAVAVLGFQPENLNRAVNVFRQLYSRGSGLVFSKPRFHLEGGELVLANSPIVPLEELAATLSDLPASPLGALEYWFNPSSYRDFSLSRWRLFALLATLARSGLSGPGAEGDHRPGPLPSQPESEAWETAREILRAFARDARAAGSVPIILHIPDRPSLKRIEAGDPPAYLELLESLKAEGVPVVDPAPEMAGGSKLYKHAHLSTRGGRVVARALARAVSELAPGARP